MTLRTPLLLILLGAMLPTACISQRSYLVGIADIPYKGTRTGMDWQISPLRAHSQYVLYGANSAKEAKSREGDYYFVEWYDADRTQPVRLEMLYTQALTASEVLSRTIEFNEPRTFSGSHTAHFFFNGPERAKRGDILSWRINLYVEGELVDSRHSYLWED